MTNPEPLDWSTTAPELALGPVYMCREHPENVADFAIDTDEGMRWMCDDCAPLTDAELAECEAAMALLDHDPIIGEAIEQAIDRELSEDAERTIAALKAGPDDDQDLIEWVLSILTLVAFVVIVGGWVFILSTLAGTYAPTIADFIGGLL